MAKTATIKLLDKNGAEYPINVRWTWQSVRNIEKELGAGWMQILTAQMGFTSAASLLMHGVRGAGETPEQKNVSAAAVEDKLQEHLDGGGTFPALMMQLLEACKELGLLDRGDAPARPTA